MELHTNTRGLFLEKPQTASNLEAVCGFIALAFP